MNFLLVADDRDVGLCLRRRIEGVDHILDWTAEGRQALECASSAKYDAVIVDLGVSEMDGIALCAGLRQISHALPILVLTERDRMTDRLESFSAGADDVLAKPFDFDELMARLAAIQRRKMPERIAPAARPARLIVLERTSDAARRTTRVVRLTDREFRFFDVLLEQKTKGVPLAAAVQQACGRDLDVPDERIGASRTRLGLRKGLAFVRGIGGKLGLSGARLGRRRAELTWRDRKARRPS